MKLIALLKDSYREAVDRKIFFAMLILTGLLTVFIASISFRRITVEDELRTVAGQLAWGMSFDPTVGKPTFAVENFRQTNDTADIYSAKSWLNDALLQPQTRDAYQRLLAQGWVDAIHHLHAGEPMYTFWDYFRNRWERNAGLRIDHLLLNPAPASMLAQAGVDRAVRGREKPSDHAPAWVVLS